MLAAVFWTALWPLVSSLHASLAAEEMPLCHQAGGAVMPGEAPRDAGDGAPSKRTQHCPLCLMAFLDAGSPPPRAPAPGLAVVDALRPAPRADGRQDLQLHLPPSRAPPVLLLG